MNATSPKRLRLVSAVVHLQLVVDDGETLAPIESQPVQIMPADLDGLAERIRGDLEAAEQQLNTD